MIREERGRKQKNEKEHFIHMGPSKRPRVNSRQLVYYILHCLYNFSVFFVECMLKRINLCLVSEFLINVSLNGSFYYKY